MPVRSLISIERSSSLEPQTFPAGACAAALTPREFNALLTELRGRHIQPSPDVTVFYIHRAEGRGGLVRPPLPFRH